MANSLRTFQRHSSSVGRWWALPSVFARNTAPIRMASWAAPLTRRTRIFPSFCPYRDAQFSTGAARLREKISDEIGGRRLTEPPETTPQAEGDKGAEGAAQEAPAYQMTFTCKKCQTRSTHRVTKQGYHHGTVLIKCPGCQSRHLISDHLKIFSDTPVTIEDILAGKGEVVNKQTVQMGDGDIEIWNKE